MWIRILSLGAGLSLMAAPTLLDYGGTWRINDTVVGAIAASVAIIATSEVLRPLRWINVLLGAWSIMAPAVLGLGQAPLGHRLLAGLLLLSSGLVRGRITTEFGGGWSSLRRP